MVQVNITRQNAEILADEGLVCEITRSDVSVAASMGGTEQVNVTRQAIEVLGSEPLLVGLTRSDVSVASFIVGTEQVNITRQSIEVLASPDATGAVTRSDVSVAATFAGPGQVNVSRQSAEVLARQGSAGPVTPLPLSDDAHIFLHNWAANATLNTSFRTDIATSPDSGAESRRGLSLKPFRSMDLEWLLCPGTTPLVKLERLEVFLRRLTNERFQVPIYMDQQELGASYAASADTILVETRRGRFFQGARVVIVELDQYYQVSAFSFHLIEDLTNDQLTFTTTLGRSVPAGSLVLPVMDCEVALEVEAVYQTARVPRVRLTVSEAPGASQLPPLKSDLPTGATEAHDGRPVWYEEPDWSRGVSKGRDRQGSRSNQGRADLVNTEADRSRQTHSFKISGSREDMWNALEFFETRRGRLRSFWHIDQDQYLRCVDIDPAGADVGVSEGGLTLADLQEEFDAIGVVMSDGTHYVRDVSIINPILTVYSIALNTNLPAGLLVSDVHRVARARLVRFASDEFEETWEHTGYMSSKINVIEVLNERDFEV